ncbi:MAG: asparagine synthase (glutamine-hydrolyzing) [Deltaproteobacteria bacterium]|nr:asparagine synthase (glutamine-hydrolyzing) [Deltaproteobacteria bacterium]
MCGLSFIWAPPPVDVAAVVARMTRAQRHRGPDALHTIVQGRAALGHARLRVLDLDARADQPFPPTPASPDSTPVLVYNGELYNHRALARRLAEHGVTLSTTSDTEVLWHALRLWGLEALPRLHGMFAFVYWDPARGEALIARDRMGIKPLQYATRAGAIAFASEARGLVASGLVDGGLDPIGVMQVMRLNHGLGSRGAIAGVRVVPPGTAGIVRPATGEVELARWYRPTIAPAPLGGRRARAAALDSAFADAVRSHLVADVPVACYLSGGLDSTGVAAEARRVVGRDLTTWSMVFPGASYSEKPAIDRIVKQLDIDHHELPITGTTLSDYARHIDHAEMPQWWTSDLALEALGRAVAARGHRVVLSGEGPDELLAGYDAFRAMRLRGLLDRLGLRGLAKVGTLAAGAIAALAPWLRGLDASAIAWYFERHAPERRAELIDAWGFYPESIAMWEALSLRHADLLTADGRDALAAAEDEARAFFATEVAPHVRGLTTLEANVLFETSVRLPSWVLHMGDRMSALNGLELRFPYLDDRVVAAMLALPERDRLDGFDEKAILKRVHRGRVPGHVLKKHKQPLYTPVRDWLEPLFADPELGAFWSEATFADVGLFDRRACERLRLDVERRRLRGFDAMTAEWAFMLVLSTLILHTTTKEAARDARPA